MIDIYTDDYFMKEALKEAVKAGEQGEVPVGAVITVKGRIIARAGNQVETLNDATAHAEILAITAASAFLGSKYLKDCCLYVTLEPCAMCIGATYWAQLGRLVYGASDPKRGFSLNTDKLSHPKTTIVKGLMARDSEGLINDFFRKMRKG